MTLNPYTGPAEDRLDDPERWTDADVEDEVRGLLSANANLGYLDDVDVKKYTPDQARDDHGRWSPEGHVGRGLLATSMPNGDNIPLSLAHKMRDGTATADDILKLVADPVGEYWGVLNRDYGVEDLRQFAQGEEGSEELTAKWLNEMEPGETDPVLGSVEILLIGDRPKDWDPADNPPSMGGLMGNSYMPIDTKVHLVEVQYNAGWGWKHLPVDRTVKTSEPDPEQAAADARAMERYRSLRPPRK